MASTIGYPKMVVNTSITGVASEATLQAVLDALSLDVITTPFYQATNSIGAGVTTVATIPALKTLQKISIKCNDGCTFVITKNGTDEIETLPSGEVQFYDLSAVAGDVIGIKQIGTLSNSGPLAINFFG
jgi:hypothetical protein